MKFIRTYTGPDLESHFEEQAFTFASDTSRTAPQAAKWIQLYQREVGFRDFHVAPRRQYLLYLSARVELGFGDGSAVTMDPGDVLLVEDLTGRGHSSRVIEAGYCAVVALGE
jgi:uncharacterized protein YjlB